MIIIDTKMPKNCGGCFACHTDEDFFKAGCSLNHFKDVMHYFQLSYDNPEEMNKPEWCPLKEVR